MIKEYIVNCKVHEIAQMVIDQINCSGLTVGMAVDLAAVVSAMILSQSFDDSSEELVSRYYYDRLEDYLRHCKELIAQRKEAGIV